jgi:predicted short-subunit dehydrogenase-like oxidoreductase (DUF2520 family)
MQAFKTISFIGSGNVATHLAKEFHKKGFIIQQICSRLLENAVILAEQVNAGSTDHLDNLDENVDLIFCCTKDELIGKITNKLTESRSIKNIVHTSGTVGLEVFDPFQNSIGQYGIFYPLQTFSKTVPVDFTDLPIGVTSNKRNFQDGLFQLAASITNKPFHISDTERKHLHIAAVLVNNFANHLFALGQKYCEDNNLDFELLKPLIRQTINKIDVINPIDAQTGPAKRGDEKIIHNHLVMLQGDARLKAIYKALTDSILQMYHGHE